MTSSKSQALEGILSPAQLEALRRLDTCTVANAIETFGVRLRNEGFTDGSIQCMFKHFPPMVGYAVTVRICCAAPPIIGQTYYERTDWWNNVLRVPAPRVVVAEDADPRPGQGAFVGEFHGNILRALGCVGLVTNGAVRGLTAIGPTGFQMFAGSVSVSHAYAHIFEFGGPVEVGNLRFSPGDLLHGDQHGVLIVPKEIAAQIPAAAQKVTEKRRRVIAFCQSPDFSLEKLREMIKEMD